MSARGILKSPEKASQVRTRLEMFASLAMSRDWCISPTSLHQHPFMNVPICVSVHLEPLLDSSIEAYL